VRAAGAARVIGAVSFGLARQHNLTVKAIYDPNNFFRQNIRPLRSR
jgi:hypothetical protein